jgi:predicted transcriptional regulator
MTKHIKIGVSDPVTAAKGFIDAWKRAERRESVETEEKLNFENLETLLKILTPGRWLLLKSLRKGGPASVRSLAGMLKRDYKNVHTDVRLLEQCGLIDRTQDNKVIVPWSIIEAKLELAA